MRQDIDLGHRRNSESKLQYSRIDWVIAGMGFSNRGKVQVFKNLTKKSGDVG